MSYEHTLTYPVYSGLLDVGTRFMYEGRLMRYTGNNVYREVAYLPPTPYQPKHAKPERQLWRHTGTLHYVARSSDIGPAGWYVVATEGWSFLREDLNQ